MSPGSFVIGHLINRVFILIFSVLTFFSILNNLSFEMRSRVLSHHTTALPGEKEGSVFFRWVLCAKAHHKGESWIDDAHPDLL